MKKELEKFKGLTLVEVMVSISIFTICIAGFSLLFIKSMKSNSYILEMGQTSMAISNGMTDLVEYIRKAKQGDNGNYAIVSASDNSLTIYADYDSDAITERLHFYLEDQQVKMGVTDPSGDVIKTYPSGDQEVFVKADHILNTSEDKLFSYYNRDYPADTVNNPIDMAINDISNIRMVEIFLKMNIDPNRAPDNVQMRSFVELRNLNDYDRKKSQKK